MDEGARIAMLEDENAFLRERVDHLERALFCDGLSNIPIEWRLTATESVLVGALFSREIATKEMLMVALYATRADDAPAEKIIDVLVCKARKKLKPFGVEIETVWGRGWAIPAETRALYRQRMKGAAA